jgi:hypothetical protein
MNWTCCILIHLTRVDDGRVVISKSFGSLLFTAAKRKETASARNNNKKSNGREEKTYANI